jgi:hypothetical protein
MNTGTKIMRGMLFLLVGSLSLYTNAKPFSFEGYISSDSSYADVTHVLREFPGGPIVVALRDTSDLLLKSDSSVLQKILGHPDYARIENDIPVLIVEEIIQPSWSYPGGELSLANHAAWSGTGSSLYPSIKNEPVPLDGGYLAPTDSDGDGVPDDSDDFPNDPNETTDTDGDGTGNNADTDDDNDGMPDEYENTNGLNPLVNDAEIDSDGDGFTNSEEYIAGTAANNSQSYFKIEDIEPDSDGMHLIWSNAPGRFYTVYQTPYLKGSYLPLTEPIETSNSLNTVTIPTTGLSTTGFFRIEVELP